jgi:hypothetical protein
MDAWRKTWRCLRCGEHFMVVPVDGSEQEAGQVAEPSSPPASAASPVPTAVPQVDEASPLPLPAVFRSGGRQATERSRLGEAPGGTMKSARDFTQYTFDGQTFGKGRLVLALIRRYIADHPGTDFAALREAFPDALQADSPLQFSTAQVVVAKLADVADGDRQRFFDKADELIDVADAKVVVSREWNRHNILNVLARAESLGYQVKLAEKEA